MAWSKAYSDGYEARKQGKTALQNPYDAKKQPREWIEWRAGHEHAKLDEWDDQAKQAH